MATRAWDIPGPILDDEPFDIENDGLRMADRMAEAEGMMPSDMTPALAMQLAREGDDFELELLKSGYYGEEAAASVTHEIALESLGQLVLRLREAAVERRWGVDEQTLLNFAFNAGHHYVEVDRARRAVVAVPAPRGVVRRKIHKFAPWFRTQHSKLSAGEPQYHAEPATNQQEDRDAAEFSRRVLRWQAEQVHAHTHRSDIAQWMLLAGSAILVTDLEYEDDPDYLQVVDPTTGEAVPIPKPVLTFEVLPPQLCWADDRVSSIADARWFGIDRPTPLAEAIAAFPEHRDLLIPESGQPDERGVSTLRRAQRLTTEEHPWRDSVADAGSVTDIDEEDEVLLLEWWAVPGTAIQAAHLDALDPSLLPFEIASDDGSGEPVIVLTHGARITLTTQGKILALEPNPFGFIPARECKFSESPGLWANAPATFLREINQAMDWAFSLWEEHLLRTARPATLEPRQARVRRRGNLNYYQRVVYRAAHNGAKPEYMNPPSMAADGIRFLDALERIWQDVAGVHEVSQGKLPASDISGVAVSLLQEQDLAQLGFAGNEMTAAFVDVMRQRLKIIQQYFPRTDPRLMQLAGNAPYLIDAFMSVDLDSGIELKVVPGTIIPRSPAAVKAEAKEAWAMGIALDRYGRPDVRRMQQVMEFGTAEQLYAEEEIDIQNARSVQDMILSLHPADAMMALQFLQQTGSLPDAISPKPEDDHLVMEYEHRMRLKSLRGDPRVHPANLALLRAVWQIHLQAIAPILLQTEPATALGAGILFGAGDDEGGQEAASDEGEEEPS